MSERHELIQLYMDRAYTRWQDHDNKIRDAANAARDKRMAEGGEWTYNDSRAALKDTWTLDQFWEQLDEDETTITDPERFCVFLGNMNYQICNGGFSQWWGNGYMCEESVQYILHACGLIKTEASAIVKTLVEDAWDAVDRTGYHKWLKDNCDADDDSEPDFDNRDTAFYAINEQFLTDAENYLKERLPKRKGDEVKLTLAEAQNIIKALTADGDIQTAVDVLNGAIADAGHVDAKSGS